MDVKLTSFGLNVNIFFNSRVSNDLLLYILSDFSPEFSFNCKGGALTGME